MKILFVDNSPDLQQKWLDPLRAEGWGALRARSSEDADRMLFLHGDSIEVVVISETLVRWAENHNFAFIVLTQTWKDKEVLTHQNSTRSAFYYQPYNGRAQDLQSAIRSYRSGGPVNGGPVNGGPMSGGKNEATQWTATRSIALEDFTNVLTKPEVTRTHTEFSIRLEAPSVLFGGEATSAGQAPAAPAPAAVAPAKPALSGIKLEATRVTTLPTEPPADATRVSIESPSSNGPRSIEISFDHKPASVPAAVKAAGNEPPPVPGLPEVMEIKIDLGLDKPAEPTKVAATVAVPADPTMVLESTKLELSQGMEVSAQINVAEVDLGEELSINDEILYQEAVGSAAPVTRAEATPPAVSPVLTQSMPPPAPVVRVIEGDEALKNYLALREQDVAVLTGQVRSSQERIAQLEMQLKVEKARSTELQHVVQKQEQQLKNYDQDKQVEVEVLYRQVEDLNQQLQERTNKAHTIEAKLRLTTDEVNKVKERVRVDIRRIRVREKELESQLEILKKDSAALLQARDEKILELKRKLDLLEFNMELIQEQYSKERQSSEDLRNRLKDAAKAMRQAGGLLEQ